MRSILKHIMKILRTVMFSLVFFLGLNKASLACDLLGINIGGDKSEIEKYFGTIEIDEEVDEGNEAKVFSSFTDKIDLSIVSQTSQSNWQGKKIAEFILQNAKSSVLYIPN